MHGVPLPPTLIKYLTTHPGSLFWTLADTSEREVRNDMHSHHIHLRVSSAMYRLRYMCFWVFWVSGFVFGTPSRESVRIMWVIFLRCMCCSSFCVSTFVFGTPASKSVSTMCVNYFTMYMQAFWKVDVCRFTLISGVPCHCNDWDSCVVQRDRTCSVSEPTLTCGSVWYLSSNEYPKIVQTHEMTRNVMSVASCECHPVNVVSCERMSRMPRSPPSPGGDLVIQDTKMLRERTKSHERRVEWMNGWV